MINQLSRNISTVISISSIVVANTLMKHSPHHCGRTSPSRQWTVSTIVPSATWMPGKQTTADGQMCNTRIGLAWNCNFSHNVKTSSEGMESAMRKTCLQCYNKNFQISKLCRMCNFKMDPISGKKLFKKENDFVKHLNFHQHDPNIISYYNMFF